MSIRVVWKVLLHWLTTGERRPALVHSGRKPEELVYKVPLRRHVVPRHAPHLTLGQHRHGLDPGQGSPRRPEARKAEHRPGQALNAAVILLNPVVEPAAPPVLRKAPELAIPLHVPESAGVALEAVGHDLPWVAGVLATKRLAEEAPGRLLVPLGAEQEVDRLAGAVDRPVQVAPLATDPYVSLIDVPRP